jgi:Glycogen recognition site of AMP-activated protein kinase
MSNDLTTPDARLDAALAAMRQPAGTEPDAIARVAARAVLANAPAARATTWTMRAAAAIAFVALGGATVNALRDGALPATPAIAMAPAPVAESDLPAVLPVANTGARPIVFEFDAPQARSVQVLGDFNQWSRDASVMERGDDGRWRLATMLPPGRYVYAFLIDGQRFERDPQRDAIEDRDFGVPGSELLVGEAP